MTCLDKYLAVSEEGRSRPFSLDTARALLLGYLFNAIDFQVLKEKLVVMGVRADREWRQRLVTDSAVLVDLKFPLFRALCEVGTDDVSAAMEAAVGLGLREDDLPLVELSCSHKNLQRNFSHLATQYRPLSWQQFNHEASRAIRELEGNTRGFVYVKMRFLQRWGYTLDDCILDCNGGAFEALLFRYPRFDNRAHFHNLFKQAVRHQGLKKVEHYTAQSRSSFQQDGDYRMEHLEDYHEGEMAHDVAEGIEDNPDVQVHQLLRSNYLNDTDKHALRLLVGQADEDFDSWLREQGESSVGLGDNIRRLRKMVMAYLDYPESRLQHLRDMLTGDFGVRASIPTVFSFPQVFR